MTAGSTYVPIQTYSPSGSASVTFSSIPQTYTDLVLIVQGSVASGNPDCALRFNGDTGTNYSITVLRSNGSAASSSRFNNQNYLFLDAATGFNTTQSGYLSKTNIMNYTNSTTYKTILCDAGNATLGTDTIVGLWRNTSAITSITVALDTATTFNSDTTITLYGIAAA